MAQTGTVRGQVVDNSRTGVGFANAMLLRLPDSSLVTGAHTQQNGRFEMTRVPAGHYALKITYIGYVPQVIGNLRVESGKTVHAGTIILKDNAKMLNEVVVKTSAPQVQYDLDKTVFNVTKDIKAVSTNATQILEQIPMVELDEEGVPSVMGQSVTVLIDGKPSKIYGQNVETVLKLIPSSAIEKVEVVTNPSARYTTEEGAIVLNIITKTDQLTGISGVVSLNANTNGNYRPSLSANLKGKKLSWNNSLSFDRDRDPYHGSVLRENLLDPVFFTQQSRSGTDNDKDFSYTGNLYYQLSAGERAGAFFGLGHDTEHDPETLFTQTLDEDKKLSSAYTRYINSHESSWQYRAGATYEKKFSNDEHHVLDIEAYYSTRDDHDDQVFDQQSDWAELNSLQHQFSISSDEGFTVDIDYVHPFSDKSRLESGIRAEWETDDNNFIPKYYDEDSGKYLIDDTLRNDYTSVERRFSAYAMYRTEINRFSLQGGVRLEKTTLETTQRILDQFFDNRFLNLIPTLNVSYRFKNQDNISFSYSRRAHRPWWRQLNPFIDYSNPENISSGNPDLKPEFINFYELRYGKFINQFSLFGSIFFRHSYHPIQQVSTIDDQGVAYTTYENIGKENYYGLETGASADVAPDWNVRLNIGLRRNDVLGFGQQYRTVAFNGRFSTFFPMIAGIRGFVYLHYRGPRSIAQGKQQGMFLGDMGIRRSFLQQKANVSLRLRDIFNQRQYTRVLAYKDFTETSSYQRNSRYLEVNVSYTFGKLQQDKKEDSDGPDRNNPGDFDRPPDSQNDL